MSKFVPSKGCPHRFCKYLHATVNWTTLAVALTGFQLWLQIGVGLVLVLKLYNWNTRRRWNIPAYKMPYERPNQYLIVRRWWARAAITLDTVLAVFVLLLFAGNMATHAAGQTSDIGSGPLPELILMLTIGTLIMLAYLGLTIFCHWMATRPGKPKRVRVPRGVSFQGV